MKQLNEFDANRVQIEEKNFKIKKNSLRNDKGRDVKNSHHSMKKMIEMKILPPLHPQTQCKKKGKINKNYNQNQEENNYRLNHQKQLNFYSISPSQINQLTATFGFYCPNINNENMNGSKNDQYAIKDDQKQKNEQKRGRQRKSFLITFGKENDKIFQKQEQKQLKQSTRYYKNLYLPYRNQQNHYKLQNNIYQIGKYQAIYVPKINSKAINTVGLESSLTYRNNISSNLQKRQKTNKSINGLPPINSKCL